MSFQTLDKYRSVSFSWQNFSGAAFAQYSMNAKFLFVLDGRGHLQDGFNCEPIRNLLLPRWTA